MPQELGDRGPVGLAKFAPETTWTAHKGTVLAVAVSPDGRTLASGGEDRMIRLWELPTCRLLATWGAHDASADKGWPSGQLAKWLARIGCGEWDSQDLGPAGHSARAGGHGSQLVTVVVAA